jgi:mRNA-degrading endonuclease RelE of RelBE toxin-antitoxin system
MTFNIKLSSQAAKFLKKQDAHIYHRLKSALQKLADDPFRFVEHFEGQYYKFRIGEYRALMDIDTANRIVWVRVLEHRGVVYNR